MYDFKSHSTLASRFAFSYNDLTVTLQDAYDIWTVDPTIVFDMKYRLAGTKSRIKNIYKKHNISFEEVHTVTINNIGDRLDYIEETRKFSLDDLKKAVNNPGEKISSVTATSTRTKTLEKRLEDLPPGYFINVSNIKENGTGVTQVKVANPIRFKYVKAIKIMSNNLDAYELAIGMLPGDHSKILKSIRNQFSMYS